MKYVLFGNIDVSLEVLKFLVEAFGKESIIVVTDCSYENNSVCNYAVQLGLIVVSEPADLIEINDQFSYGFTIRYNRILRKNVIDLFENGIINMHGGPLPEFKGSANHVFAILEGAKEFGVTLHYVTPELDKGDVIQQETFPIENDHTGYDLFLEGKRRGLLLIEKVIGEIKRGKRISGSQQNPDMGKTYRIKDLEKYRTVDLEKTPEEEIIKRLKAFYHPFRESIYTYIGNTEVSLKLKKIDKNGAE